MTDQQATGARGIFDPLLGKLEDFFNSNAADILTNSEKELVSVFEPIKPFFGKKIRGEKAVKVLGQSFARAEKRFAEICRGHGLDDWLAILRRAPTDAIRRDYNWSTYLTLGLVKYCDPELDTTFGTFATENQHAIVHGWKDAILFEAARLGTLAHAMGYIAGVIRWVGKGAEFSPSQEKPLYFDPDVEVYAAVAAYEKRRPSGFFRDQGLIAQNLTGKGEMVFGLGGFRGAIWLDVPGSDMSLNVNDLPRFFEWAPVWRILEHYREAIEDLFKIRLEAIEVFFRGLYENVWPTLLWPEEVREEGSSLRLILPKDDGSSEFKHRLDFTFRLLRTGYLRFPRAYWISVLSKQLETECRVLLENFFDAFSLTPAKRQNVDLSVLRPDFGRNSDLTLAGDPGNRHIPWYSLHPSVGSSHLIEDLIDGSLEWQRRP